MPKVYEPIIPDLGEVTARIRAEVPGDPTA
jgi:hypothetical protein